MMKQIFEKLKKGDKWLQKRFKFVIGLVCFLDLFLLLFYIFLLLKLFPSNIFGIFVLITGLIGNIFVLTLSLMISSVESQRSLSYSQGKEIIKELKKISGEIGVGVLRCEDSRKKE